MQPMTIETKEALTAFYGWDNYLRICDLEKELVITDENREERRKLFSNLLIRFKRLVRKEIKDQQIHYMQYRKHERMLKDMLEMKSNMDIVPNELENDIEDVSEFVDNLSKILDSHKKTMCMFGEIFLQYFPIYSFVASDEDIASILSVNIKAIEKARESYKKHNKGQNDFMTHCVFVERVEPDEDCPFFSCVVACILKEIKENEAHRKIAGELIDDIIRNSDIKPLTVTDKANGGVEVKEYYVPPKRVK